MVDRQKPRGQADAVFQDSGYQLSAPLALEDEELAAEEVHRKRGEEEADLRSPGGDAELADQPRTAEQATGKRHRADRKKQHDLFANSGPERNSWGLPAIHRSSI